jgi:hypothetical protein
LIGVEGGEVGRILLVAKSIFLVLHYFFFLSKIFSPKGGPTFILKKTKIIKKDYVQTTKIHRILGFHPGRIGCADMHKVGGNKK